MRACARARVVVPRRADRGADQVRHAVDGGVDLRRMQTEPAYAMAIGRQFYNADLLGPAALACACTAGDPAVANGVSNGLHVLAQALFHQGALQMEQALRACTLWLWLDLRFPGAYGHVAPRRGRRGGWGWVVCRVSTRIAYCYQNIATSLYDFKQLACHVCCGG